MRQHKRNGGDQWILGCLAAGHRAVHHFAHVMPTIHFGMRRSLLFLVMMLRDRAGVPSAASHCMR
jgi:hypothetical protein